MVGHCAYQRYSVKPLRSSDEEQPVGRSGALTCMFETTRLQGDARYLAHNTEVPLHLFRGNPQNPTMAIVVPKALGGPHRRDS